MKIRGDVRPIASVGVRIKRSVAGRSACWSSATRILRQITPAVWRQIEALLKAAWSRGTPYVVVRVAIRMIPGPRIGVSWRAERLERTQNRTKRSRWTNLPDFGTLRRRGQIRAPDQTSQELMGKSAHVEKATCHSMSRGRLKKPEPITMRKL